MPAPAANGIGEDVEHHRGVLHPLHRRLERLVLQCHDHVRLGVERRVDEARQRGQVALGAGDGEHEVTARLEPRFLQADLERVLAPLAPDPVGGADDGDRLRLGGRGGHCAVLSAALPASPLPQAPSPATRIRADAASARAGRNREPDRSNIGRTPGKERGTITKRCNVIRPATAYPPTRLLPQQLLEPRIPLQRRERRVHRQELRRQEPAFLPDLLEIFEQRDPCRPGSSRCARH